MVPRPNGLASRAAALLLALALTACGGAAAPTGVAMPAPTAMPAQLEAPGVQLPAAAPTSAPTLAPAQATDSQAPAAPLPTPATSVEFTRTADDNLSTFALDVDTGSYTLARGALESGQLPPPELVRVEEFVNAFDYDYPSPQDTFGITVDAALLGDGQTQLVRVGVQGRTVDEGQRADSVLTFVVDVSGSMQSPERLPLVKQSLRLLVEQLRPSDRVALVVYGSQARVVLDHTAAADRDRILAAIDSLGEEGSTNAEAGLALGYGLAAQAFAPGANNRVILCSDGVANVGATGPDAILARIRDHAAQGIYLTTVGFGMGGYNDQLMEQLADDGNGSYAYVDRLEAARRVFVEELTGTLQVIAKDAKVQVVFDPAVVASYRLLGYENRAVADADFRNDRVDAGEVGAGHSATALYEVTLTGQAQGEMLAVQLRYADPASGEVRELRQGFASESIAASLEAAPVRLQQAAAVAFFAEALRGPQAERGARLEAARTIAARIAPQLANDEQAQELLRLIGIVESLSR